MERVSNGMKCMRMSPGCGPHACRAREHERAFRSSLRRGSQPSSTELGAAARVKNEINDEIRNASLRKRTGALGIALRLFDVVGGCARPVSLAAIARD